VCVCVCVCVCLCVCVRVCVCVCMCAHMSTSLVFANVGGKMAALVAIKHQYSSSTDKGSKIPHHGRSVREGRTIIEQQLTSLSQRAEVQSHSMKHCLSSTPFTSNLELIQEPTSNLELIQELTSNLELIQEPVTGKPGKEKAISQQHVIVGGQGTRG